MLAQNIGIDICDIDITFLAQHETKARGIKNRTGTDDAALGQPSLFLNNICKDIHRIRDNYNQRILSMFHNAFCNGARNLYIALCQIEARLPGLSGETGRYDDNLCIGTFGIVPLAHSHLLMKSEAMVDI